MIKMPKRKKIYSGWEKLPNEKVSGDIQQGCLVIEGGAFRGVYHQGVLDAFLQNNINIHTCIGTSAGCLAALNYVAGHVGRSARLILGYRHHPLLVGWKGLLKTRCIVNVDFLLYDINEIDLLDEEALLSPSRHYVVPVTNCLNGKTEYMDVNNCSDMIRASKASASMQFTSPMVKINDIPYLDSGCTTDIPFRWALEQNFEKIVIVRTMHREFRKPDKMKKSGSFFYPRYPEFAAAINRKNLRYNEECDAIEELEKSGRAFVIYPSRPVTVGRIESDMEKLGELYWQGYEDGLANIEAVKAYLNS